MPNTVFTTIFETAFTAVLNMSIAASVAAVIIIFIRLLMGNRLQKIFNYALWAIVLFRLLIPFSVTSVFSIFNALPALETLFTPNNQFQISTDANPYKEDYESILQDNQDKAFIVGLNNSKNSSLPISAAETLTSQIQPLLSVISWIWFAVAATLILLIVYTYFHAARRLQEAVLYNHAGLISGCSQKLKLNRKVQVFTSDKISTPVVYGLLKPYIILPSELASSCTELELEYIITHELVHIKRFDNMLKPLSILSLCIHWFNPIIWLSFKLTQKDMEMSCDQKVMSVFENDIRSEYAASLIKLAAKQNTLLNGGLPAFGESNIKSRIKGIMSFKKPVFRLITTIIVILIASGIVLMTGGQSKANNEANNKNGKKISSESTAGIESTNITEVAGIIDKLLSTIMSSPSYSSRTGDYIKEHQKEYDEIVTMGEEALHYLTEILDAGDKGLRGNIVCQLCETIVKNLSQNGDINSEKEKLIKEAKDSIDKWKALMGYVPSMQNTKNMPEFSNEEVAAARAVVEEYYRAVAIKDSEAILSTMYPRNGLTMEHVKSGNVQLYGTETRTLISIDYDSQDQMRKSYRPNNHPISDENIIVFKVSFSIKYNSKEGGPWNEGVYKNWSMILIRDDEKSPWLIYDQGY